MRQMSPSISLQLPATIHFSLFYRQGIFFFFTMDSVQEMSVYAESVCFPFSMSVFLENL